MRSAGLRNGEISVWWVGTVGVVALGADMRSEWLAERMLYARMRRGLSQRQAVDWIKAQVGMPMALEDLRRLERGETSDPRDRSQRDKQLGWVLAAEYLVDEDGAPLRSRLVWEALFAGQ